ncbi:MAG: M36 family metallopeptidase, partial [Acidobacteriota bacterium]
MPRSVTHRPATQRFMVKPYLPVLLAVLLGTLAAAGAHAAPAGESPVRFLTGPQAGEPVDLALGYLNANREAFGLSASDLADMVIVDHYRTRHNGVTHVYLRQRLDGVEVWNGDININVARDGSIINLGNRFVSDLAGRAVSRSPGIDAETAVQRAATHLGLVARSSLTVLENAGGPSLAVTFDGTGISHRPIPVKLVYERTDAGPRLAWDVVIDPVDSPNWWDMRVDAETGEVLGKVNWTDSESHGVAHHGVAHHGEAHHGEARGGIPQDSYNVLPLPLESPYDGAHSLHTGPADPTASPFGWHDTDGDIDPDFTDTRGNNVEASEDTDGNNIPGFRPSGGSGPVLTFNYAWNAGDQPDGGTNQEAAIVNLFYMNNVMHDLTYQYGFDEPSGNFQFNTYGR